MDLKSHRSIWLFLLTLGSLSIGGCLATQALPGSASGIDSGVLGSDGVEPDDSGDGSGSSSNSDPFPDPFEEPRGDPGIPPIAMSDEPSVFSTQVGTGNNPGLREIICDIEISVSLINSGGEHDGECPAGENSPSVPPPQAMLRSLDSDFFETYAAVCEDKDPSLANWTLYAQIEKYFFYVPRGEAVSLPRYFELELFYLIDGYWQRVALHSLAIVCEDWGDPSPP